MEHMLQGLCYRTCVLHGCRRLVHGRRHPQEDLLPPGDPAWGRGETRAHQLAAAAGQTPFPAFAIAARDRSAVRDVCGKSRVTLVFTESTHTEQW